MDRYEIAIIGSGPAGYVGAIKAARAGVSVCVIEEREFGGVCLNTGCIPTKALIASAKVLRHARRCPEFGIVVPGPVEADFPRLHERKRRVVDIEKQGLLKLVSSSGAKIINGRASFIDKNTLRISGANGDQSIYAKNIIIATGSKPRSLPLLPFDRKKVFSSDNILELEEFPKSMLIIGGGYIGCEFASMLQSFGMKINIIEALPRILAGIDEDISDILVRQFKKEDIICHTNTKIASAKVDDTVSVTFEDGSVLTADCALVSIGRRASSDGIGLENIGVEVQPNGNITVNNQMMTNVPGIFAVGDVVGSPMLAHIASAECSVAVGNALGNHLIMDYTVVPSAIYTYPEIGTIGLTEKQARDMGMDVKTGSILIRSLGISHAASEITGTAKIVANAISDEIVGVHAIGERATDVIHEVAVAMFQGLTASALGRVIHAHPTFSEMIVEAANDVGGGAIHVREKAA